MCRLPATMRLIKTGTNFSVTAEDELAVRFLELVVRIRQTHAPDRRSPEFVRGNQLLYHLSVGLWLVGCPEHSRTA